MLIQEGIELSKELEVPVIVAASYGDLGSEYRFHS